MQANDKMPPFKWAIVYFNRFVPLAVAVTGLFKLVYQLANGGVGIQAVISYVLVIGGGFLVKEILYQSRASIYGMGQSRFYFLLIVFYIPWLINAFMANDFNEVPIYLNLTYLNQLNPADLVYYKLLVFSPAIGVIWYIFDIEFDRKKRREMDIKALLIEESQIQRWDNDLVNGATIFSIGVIGLYSLVLVTLCMTVWLIASMADRKLRQMIYMASGILFSLLGLSFKVLMVNFAHGWWSYWLEYGLFNMLYKQVISAGSVFEYGVSLDSCPILFNCSIR